MKKLIISIALTFMLGAGFAQMSSSEQALIKSVFNTEKKILVQEQMNLTEEHAKLFWPIYEKYETENGQLDDKSFDILNRYAENFEGMSAEQAKSIGQDLMSMRTKNEKIRKKYYNQVSKQISPIVALRFVLLENYIESMVRFSILDELPFVGDELIH